MKIAGLTGGIATGKTTVAKMFSRMGVKVIDADEIAHQVVRRGSPAFSLIVREFGEEILGVDGEIDRKKLGNIIFFSEEKRKRLNQIVHPFVREKMMQKIQEVVYEDEHLLLDVPLLFETGVHKWLRPVILVYAPEEVQVKRLMERDKLTKEEAQARINAQMSIEKKKQLADYVIDNSGSIEETEKQVREIWVKIFGPG